MPQIDLGLAYGICFTKPQKTAARLQFQREDLRIHQPRSSLGHVAHALHSGEARITACTESGSAGEMGNVAGGDCLLTDLAGTLLGETTSTLAVAAFNFVSGIGLRPVVE